MNVNTIMLRRKNTMLVPTSKGTTPRAVIATFNANLQNLGFTLSPKVIKALEHTSETTAVRLMDEALTTLKEVKGMRNYRPMYPNFPKQVMEASDAELYLNALVHYLSFVIVDLTLNPDNIWLPKYAKEKRALLDEKFKVTVIDLATEKDVEALATAIATSNTSLSPTDKDDLRHLYDMGHLDFPELVPNKENLAFLGALFMNSNLDLAPHFKTATDVLRLATGMSNGDVSLTDDSKFRQFSHPERRFLLGLLNKCGNLEEDMLRWKQRWLRLGERLHPGKYPKLKQMHRAFSNLRNTKIRTVRTHIEAAARGGDTVKAITLLAQRPGDFARRLDHLLRQAEGKAAQNRVVNAFLAVAPEVSTPVLLQVKTHFKHRQDNDLRVVFPKGNVAKVMSLDKLLTPLCAGLCSKIAEGIDEVLVDRFSKLPELGKVYVDPNLVDCLVPFSQRSASKSFRTLVRGSKLSLGDGDNSKEYDSNEIGHRKDTVRFFIWWHENTDGAYEWSNRADIDLSATLLDENFNMVEALTYYNLRGDFGCHSGDITSAPKGASEFIDINIPKAIARGARYVTMDIRSFTGQNFCDLKECFAGFMLREKPQSGEIFDPRTVIDRVDVTMAATTGMPLIIDLVERKVIWCDAAMTTNRYAYNNVHSNKGTIELLGRAFTSVRKPNLYDLLSLHAKARGKIMLTPEKADVVFSVENGTPFELERIASEFMSDVKVEKAAAGKRR